MEQDRIRGALERQPPGAPVPQQAQIVAQTAMPEANGFDYKAPAELFPSRVKIGRARIAYRRFASAAEALRFAVEETPASALLGAYIEVNEARLDMREAQRLYDSPAYPLKRKPKAAASGAPAQTTKAAAAG
jgi:hypothetical protein